MKIDWSLNDGQGWLYDLKDNMVYASTIPLCFMRHLCHVFCVMFSLLAVIASVTISHNGGTKYPQYVEVFHNDLFDASYDFVPKWYVWFTAQISNYISTFHSWAIDWIDENFDGGGDDDDFSGGEPQEVDEHEDLEQPA